MQSTISIENEPQFPPGKNLVLTTAEVQLHFDNILDNLSVKFSKQDDLLVNYILELSRYYEKFPEYQPILLKMIVGEILDFKYSYNSQLEIHSKVNELKEKFKHIYNQREVPSERKEEVKVIFSNLLFDEKKRRAYFLYSLTLFCVTLNTSKENSYLQALGYITKIKASYASNAHEKFIQLMALYELSEIFVNTHKNPYDKYFGIINTKTWQSLMHRIRNAAYTVIVNAIKDADSYTYIKHLRFIKNQRIMNEHRSNDPTIKLFKYPTQTIKIIEKRIQDEKNIIVANEKKSKHTL